MEALGQRWRVLAMRVDALSFRERVLVMIAAIGIVLSVIYLGLIEPVLKSEAQIAANTSEALRETSSLRQQLSEARSNKLNGDVNPIDRLRAETASLEKSISAREKGMVPPDRMISVLKDILNDLPGLTLISLQTQPPQPVLKDTTDFTATLNDGNPTNPLAPVLEADQRYRHEVEIHVQGSYANLTRYVQWLEDMPWAMQWKVMRLDAKHYPQVDLTLRLATLSREATWAKF